MDRQQEMTREHIQRGMRDYERGVSRDANPCVGVTARAEWFEGYDNAKRIHEQETRETEWMGGEAALIPEREGDTTMLLCQRIGGKLVYTQRAYTNAEMKSGAAFANMKSDLSRMLAQLEHHPRHRAEPESRYDPEKEPRFDPNHKHDD